jgi:hypothetical protein
MKKRIINLSNKKIADFCFEAGWSAKRLPYGFPKAEEVSDIINGNSPDILEEAFRNSPELNVWEYVALRCCNDDFNNPELWVEKEKAERECHNHQDKCPKCGTLEGNGIYPSVNAKGNYIDKWECDNCKATWTPKL